MRTSTNTTTKLLYRKPFGLSLWMSIAIVRERCTMKTLCIEYNTLHPVYTNFMLILFYAFLFIIQYIHICRNMFVLHFNTYRILILSSFHHYIWYTCTWQYPKYHCHSVLKTIEYIHRSWIGLSGECSKEAVFQGSMFNLLLCIKCC